MQLAELAGAPIPSAAETVVSGWGGGPGVSVSLARPEGLDQLSETIAACTGGAIARGMGRSYGDAAQLSGGVVVDVTGLKGIELESETGTVTAGSGVTIGELLEALVPAGWMVPVVPGTQHVSVGGAIASDIHGKNHGTAGTFGSHVEQITLMTSAPDVCEVGPGDELFEATLGGMGLTGVILSARLKLRAIRGPLLAVDTDKVDSLERALDALRAPGGDYRVAWLDLLCARPGRGIVTRADHIDGGAASATVRARATVPRGWPPHALRPSSVRAFNALRYARAPRSERGHSEPIARHMFPLDALDAWPRLYGPRGLLQYQLVIPGGAERVLETVIERLRRTRVPCYLAVLKDFGPANGAPLSFPTQGWTLALDVPRAAAGVELLLEGFDQLVAEAGGRVYLSKDARMKPDLLGAMYPRLDEWRAARERADSRGLWRSDLAVRVGLV
jgi:decaprenylphospho-beta-D-ribofuranose 2-oxidase